MTHVIDNSSRIRMIIASDRPTFRARARSCCGSLPARIEMKTMLSIPRTISRTVSVPRAIHPSALLVQPIAAESHPLIVDPSRVLRELGQIGEHTSELQSLRHLVCRLL